MAYRIRVGIVTLLLAGGASASGPTAALFGVVAEDRRPFEAGGAYGAEGRLGWSFLDELALEVTAGFTRSEPQSWLLHAGVGPKLALFASTAVSPYLRGNVGVGARTPTQVVCPASTPSCATPSAGWTVTAAASGGVELQVIRAWRVAAEIGWRRFFFEDGRSPSDVRGLWLGFSFR